MNILRRLLTPTIRPKRQTQAAPGLSAPIICTRDGQALPIFIKQSSRANRLRLRLARDAKSIIITAPKIMSEKKALAFAHQSLDWIEAQLNKAPKHIPFANGAILPINGINTRLEIALPRTRPQSQDGTIKIPCADINFDTKAKVILKKVAQKIAKSHMDRLTPYLTRQPSKLRITDTKSRWGSCSHDGVISLCWRLIFAPPEVFNYVIAHELAHLKEMNHSKAFWDEVKRICPDYKFHYKWLKTNGAKLHMYGA